MLADVWHIAMREYRVRVFRWSFWFVGFGLPALGFALMMALASSTQSGDRRVVGLIDEVGVEGLADRLEGSPLIEARLGGEELFAALEAGEVSAVVELGSELRTDSWAAYRSSEPLPRAHQTALERAIQFALLEASLKATGVETAILDDGVELRFEDSDGAAKESALSVATGVAGAGVLLMWFTLLSLPVQLVMGVLEERESGLIEAVLGFTEARSLLLGKVMGLAAVTATLTGLWALPGLFLLAGLYAVLPADQAADLPGIDVGVVFVIALVLTYLMNALLAAILASGLQSKQQAESANFVLVLAQMVPLLVGIPAVSNPGSFTARVLTFVPPFSPIIAFARYPVGGPPWEIFVGLAISAVAVLVLLYVADRVFRATALGAWKPTWRRPIPW